MALMLVSQLCFVAMGTCYRLAMLDGLPVPLVPFARGLFTLLLMAPWMLRQGVVATLATRRPKLHLARGTAGLVGFLSGMLAILWLPLADAVAITNARPLWVLPFAVLLLGERVGWDRALAAAAGFAGVLIVAQPDGTLSAGLVAALIAGAAGALVMIAVKALAATEPPLRVAAWYGLVSVVVWGPVSAVVWETPSGFAMLMLLIGSCCALAGDITASLAARRADVGLLAPVEYAQIPLSAGVGALVFGERPGWELAAGSTLMAAATLYLARGAARGR